MGRTVGGIGIVEIQLAEEGGIDGIRPGMKILGSEVDQEAMAFEVDLHALHIAADGVPRLEQDHIPRTIEEPRQRHTGHAAPDDRDRPPSGSRRGVMVRRLYWGRMVFGSLLRLHRVAKMTGRRGL